MSSKGLKMEPLARHKGNWTRDRIEQGVRELGEWFHNMELRGVLTAPKHFLGDYPALKWRQFAHALPSNMQGMTVLDIGCNGGFYCIEMKRRGADRVVGIDSDERYLKQARFAAEVCECEIDFHRLSVYDVALLGEKFDLVLFMGVFYHLRHPLLALDLLHEHVVKDTLVFQSMLRGTTDVMRVEDDYPFCVTDVFEQPGFPKMYFIENRYSGDPTNWWIPDRACMEAMLRSSGFEVNSHPEPEVYICRRMEVGDFEHAAYPAKGRDA